MSLVVFPFKEEDPSVVAYFDGNSLGRPLRATASRMDAFVREQWGGRLIRGWTDEWLEWPLVVGDRLGAVALGAGPGQVVVADSTTVLLYKLVRAAVDAQPDRRSRSGAGPSSPARPQAGTGGETPTRTSAARRAESGHGGRAPAPRHGSAADGPTAR